MTPEETLLKAADDLAQYGHTKESFFETSGEQTWHTAPACAFGALARVIGGDAINENGVVTGDDTLFAGDVVRRLANTIRAKGPQFVGADNYQTITGYNDLDSTTGEDMILAMKEAASG